MLRKLLLNSATTLILLVTFTDIQAQHKKIIQEEQKVLARLYEIPRYLRRKQEDSVLAIRQQVAAFYRQHRKWNEYVWHQSSFYLDALKLNKLQLIDSVALDRFIDTAALFCKKHPDILIYARNTLFVYYLHTKTKHAPLDYILTSRSQSQSLLPADSAPFFETQQLISQWYALNNRYDSALSILKTISPAYLKKNKARPGQAYPDFIKKMAVIYERLRDFEHAKNCRLTLIQHFKDLNDTTEALRQTFHLVNMLLEVAYNIDYSRELLNDAAQLLQNYKGNESHARYHQLLGRFHYHMADYDKSAASLKYALSKLKVQYNSELYALISRDLTQTYEKLEAIDSAIAAFQVFYHHQFANNLDPERKEINKDIYLTNLLIKAGRLDELKNMKKKLISRAETSTDNDEKMLMYYNILKMIDPLNDTTNQQAVLQNLMSLWQKSSKKTPLIRETAYLNIAALLSKWLLEQKNLLEADRQAKYIDDHFEKYLHSDRKYLAAAIINVYQKNLITKSEILLNSPELSTKEVTHWIYQKNKLDSVLYVQVIQIFSLRDQAQVLKRQAELKASALALIYRLSQLNPTELLTKQLFCQQINRGYGHLLNYQKKEYQNKLKSGIPDSILKVEFTLRNRLGAISSDYNAAIFQRQIRELDNFYAKNKELYNRLIKVDPSTHSFNVNIDMPIAKTGELKIIYFPTDNGIYSASITTKDINIHFAEDSNWRSKVRNFRKAIVKMSTNFRQQSDQIYQLLLNPHLKLEDKSIKKLKIIAADELLNLPYSAIMIKHHTKKSEKIYLVQRYIISQQYESEPGSSIQPRRLRSVHVIAPFDDSNTKTANLHLPNTQKELTAIKASATLAGVRYSSYTRHTIDALKNLSIKSDSAINLHFITHAGIPSTNADSAFLLLTNIEDIPTKMYATDMYGLRIQPHHVFLSACESGRGKYVNNEGLIGLTRAFFFLGAEHVIASIWQVSDASTANLSQEYYRYYFTYENPDYALAMAQRSLIKSNSYQHPFYWSAFIIIQSN